MMRAGVRGPWAPEILLDERVKDAWNAAPQTGAAQPLTVSARNLEFHDWQRKSELTKMSADGKTPIRGEILRVARLAPTAAYETFRTR